MPEGAEAKGDGDIAEDEERQEDGGGQVRRTGPTIYIFISSSWRAIRDSDRKRERASKTGRKKKKEQRVLGVGLGKFFGHSPRKAALRIAAHLRPVARTSKPRESEFATFARSRERNTAKARMRREEWRARIAFLRLSSHDGVALVRR